MNENICPTVKEAVNFWLKGIKYRQEEDGFALKDEYVFHTQGIAFVARIIASHIPDMNPEKAYICGLLHDYGKKYDEKKIGRFHGLIGYHELQAEGFSLPARICLTHTFPEKKILFSDFPSYPQKDLEECQKILNELEYNDYDRLIQFADRLFEGLSMVPFAKRAKAIGERYHLSESIVNKLIADGQKLKDFLDKRCGMDIYKIIGL